MHMYALHQNYLQYLVGMAYNDRFENMFGCPELWQVHVNSAVRTYILQQYNQNPLGRTSRFLSHKWRVTLLPFRHPCKYQFGNGSSGYILKKGPSHKNKNPASRHRTTPKSCFLFREICMTIIPAPPSSPPPYATTNSSPPNQTRHTQARASRSRRPPLHSSPPPPPWRARHRCGTSWDQKGRCRNRRSLRCRW